MESKTEVIEKRVKGTVIRRRVKVTPAEEIQEAPVLVQETKSEKVEVVESKKNEVPLVQQSVPLPPLEVKTEVPHKHVQEPPQEHSQSQITSEKSEKKEAASQTLETKLNKPVATVQEDVHKTSITPSTSPSVSSVASKPAVPTVSSSSTVQKPVSSRPVVHEIKTTKTFPQRPVQTAEDDDRPRYGLKIVGRMEIKPPPPKPAPKTDAKPKPGTPAPKTTGTGVAVAPKILLPEEEAGKDKKVKKIAKKGKREELEVDLDGIGKVATLTQLTRLAATVVPEKTVVSGRDREVVFEPNRGLRRKKSRKEGKKTEVTLMKASKRVVKMGDQITVADLAHEMSVKSSELIKN